MASKSFLIFGVILVLLLSTSSEVVARELADTSKQESTQKKATATGGYGGPPIPTYPGVDFPPH